MQIDVITLFPNLFEPMISGSIVGRAREKGLAAIAVHNLRDFVPPGERADDAPYGGGPGMVLRLGPLVAALEHLLGSDLRVAPGCKVIVPSPAGARFNDAHARSFSALDRLIFVCGHYEGIDNRIFELVDAVELSLGDFVLTGGEIPAMAFIDACVRLVPGVIDACSAAFDSFAEGALDWPHYTRPSEFRGAKVPDVLLSGDHAKIAQWRRAQADLRTRERRPDLKP